MIIVGIDLKINNSWKINRQLEIQPMNVFTDKDVNSISTNTIDFSYGSKGTKQSSFNSYYKNETGYLDFTASDFITDGIDATGDGDLDPSDRQSFGLNIGGDISNTTSVSLNMIDSKANIMYDDTWGRVLTNFENDLRQIGLSVNQKFSDKLQTRIDINDQNILRHGSKYDLNTMSIVNELDFDLKLEPSFLGVFEHFYEDSMFENISFISIL